MSIKELAAAYAAATLGEWEVHDGLIYGHADEEGSFLVCDLVGDPAAAVCEQDILNGEYLCLAHNMMPPMLAAVEALEAIRARFDGVFDHPALVKYGPLDTSAERDMYRLADNALENLK